MKIAALGEHLTWQALEVRHMTRRHQIVRVQPVQCERKPAASGLDDRDPQLAESLEDASADERAECGHPGPRVRKAVEEKPGTIEVERPRCIGRSCRASVSQQG